MNKGGKSPDEVQREKEDPYSALEARAYHQASLHLNADGAVGATAAAQVLLSKLDVLRRTLVWKARKEWLTEKELSGKKEVSKSKSASKSKGANGSGGGGGAKGGAKGAPQGGKDGASSTEKEEDTSNPVKQSALTCLLFQELLSTSRNKPPSVVVFLLCVDPYIQRMPYVRRRFMILVPCNQEF
jgi:hypothetical protein